MHTHSHSRTNTQNCTHIPTHRVSAIPYAVASVVMYFNSRSSDQKGERFMHVVVFSVGSAIAFALLAMVVRFHLSVFLGF